MFKFLIQSTLSSEWFTFPLYSKIHIIRHITRSIIHCHQPYRIKLNGLKLIFTERGTSNKTVECTTIGLNEIYPIFDTSLHIVWKKRMIEVGATLEAKGGVNTVVRVSSRVGSKRTPWLIDTRLDPGLCSSADSLPRGGSTVGGYRKTLVGRPIRPRLYLDAGRTRGLTTHKNNAYASSMNLGHLRPLSFLKVRKKMAKRMCQHLHAVSPSSF